MTESEQLHSTLNGLNEWYKRTFEQAGWVVLAHHKTSSDTTYGDKVATYKNSIKRLIKHLNSRLANPQGNNTIVRDFPTMITNLTELKSFFDNMGSINENVETVGDLAIPDATLYALQNFFKHVFHKLGWMVLTHNKLKSRAYAAKPELEQHMQHKLKMYKNCLNIVHQSLVERLKTTNDVDKANVEYDLASMIRNIKLLRGCVEAHLTADGLTLTPTIETIESKQSARQSLRQSGLRPSTLASETSDAPIPEIINLDSATSSVMPVSEMAPVRQSRISGSRTSGLRQSALASATSDAPVPQSLNLDSVTSSVMPVSEMAPVRQSRISGSRSSGLASATSDVPVPEIINLDSATSSVMPVSEMAPVRQSRISGLRPSGLASATSDAPVPEIINIDSATSSVIPVSEMAPVRQSRTSGLKRTSLASETSDVSVPQALNLDSATSSVMPVSEMAPVRQSGLRTSRTSGLNVQSPQTLSANALADLVQNLTPEPQSDSIKLSALRTSGLRTSGLRTSGVTTSLQQIPESAPVEIANIANAVVSRQSLTPTETRLSGQRLSGQRLSGQRLSGQSQPQSFFDQPTTESPSRSSGLSRTSSKMIGTQGEIGDIVSGEMGGIVLPIEPVGTMIDKVGERQSGRMSGVSNIVDTADLPNLTFTDASPRQSSTRQSSTRQSSATDPLNDLVNLFRISSTTPSS